MAENRRDLLAQLETTLSTITEVKTVVRTLVDIDITNYNEAELPLIAIREPLETAAIEMTSFRAIQRLETKLKVFFVVWGENPTTAYETLIKKIRDKMGSNFKLDGKANKALVKDVSPVDGEMPVYFFLMDLDIRYYLDQKAT